MVQIQWKFLMQLQWGRLNIIVRLLRLYLLRLCCRSLCRKGLKSTLSSIILRRLYKMAARGGLPWNIPGRTIFPRRIRLMRLFWTKEKKRWRLIWMKVKRYFRPVQLQKMLMKLTSGFSRVSIRTKNGLRETPHLALPMVWLAEMKKIFPRANLEEFWRVHIFTRCVLTLRSAMLV